MTTNRDFLFYQLCTFHRWKTYNYYGEPSQTPSTAFSIKRDEISSLGKPKVLSGSQEEFIVRCPWVVRGGEYDDGRLIS